MPPKKKKAAVTTLVGEYDVEIMKENELRLYVKALEEERKRMREACSLYSKDKSELLNFLNSVQSDTIRKKKRGIQKNFKLQEQMLKEEEKLQPEDELLTIMKIENFNQTQKYTVDSYINLVTAKIRNKEEEHELLNDITEKNREIEELKCMHKLIAIESKHNYFTDYQEISRDFKNTFDNLVTEYHANFLETLEEFSQNKIKKLQEILGDASETEISPLIDEIAKMTLYFKDIFWKNIKKMNKLRSVLTNLKQDLKSITLGLRDVLNENEEFYSQARISPRASLITDPSFSQLKQKKLEELTYENHLLSVKLEILNKEYLDLKKKFVFAVRRIYQTADCKAFLLQKKLSAIQKNPGNPTV